MCFPYVLKCICIRGRRCPERGHAFRWCPERALCALCRRCPDMPHECRWCPERGPDLPTLTCLWLALTARGPHHMGDPSVNDSQVTLRKSERPSCAPCKIIYSQHFQNFEKFIKAVSLDSTRDLVQMGIDAPYTFRIFQSSNSQTSMFSKKLALNTYKDMLNFERYKKINLWM